MIHTSLPGSQHCYSVVEEEAVDTEEHRLEAEDILVEDIPVVVDIPVVDIPVVDKRPWDIPQMDNLQNSIDPQNQIQIKKPNNKQTNQPCGGGTPTGGCC